jgi:hypothetical protein
MRHKGFVMGAPCCTIGQISDNGSGDVVSGFLACRSEIWENDWGT